MTNLDSQIKLPRYCKSSLQPQNHQIGASLSKKKQNKSNQNNNSEDELFEPDYHTMKKLKFPINRQRLSMGNWSLYQNKVYLSFLINNRQSFVDQATRRQDRVFCRLSELLNKKRTPDQCRSHHQKLLGDINNSIENLIKKIESKIEKKQKKFSSDVKKVEIFNKLEEQEIAPLKIEEEKLKETVLPDMEIKPTLKLQHKTNLVYIPETVIERDFYKLTTYKKRSLILLQIEEEFIKIY